MKLKSGEELIIEKAKKEDAEKIIEYCNIVGGESDNLTFGKGEFHISLKEEQNYIESLNESKTSTMLIGKINDDIVCMGNVSSPSKKRLAHQSDIGITVKKDYWSKGVGTLLLNEMISFARKNGVCEVIHLGVRADNIHAIKLYKKLGFQEIGVYKKFFKIGEEYFDEVLMNLYL